MNKFRMLIITAFFLINSMLLAQEAGENTLRWLEGGKFNIDFALQTDLFCGVGGNRNAGCASLTGDVSAIFWNPALLTHLAQRQILLDILPPLSLYIANYYDLRGSIKNTVDNAIINYRTKETTVSYPVVTPVLHHQGGIKSIYLAVPLSQKWTNYIVGIGYSRAFDLQFGLIGTGLSSLLETKKDLGTQSMVVKLRSNIDMNVQAKIQLSRVSLALSRKWAPKWSAGITFDRYYGNAFIDGEFMIDGIMATAGNEFAFNDPYDQHINFENGEQNDLNQSIYASFTGKGWGIKLGGAFQYSENLIYGAILEIIPVMTFRGEMEVMQNIIPALNTEVLLGESDPEAEIMNPAKLDLAKLTLTVPYDNPTDDKCLLQLPSSLQLGIAFKRGFWRGNVNLTTYFSGFSLRTLNTTRGIKFNYRLHGVLNLRYVQLGWGIIHANEIRRGTDNDEEALKNILLPQFSLGANFRPRQYVEINSLIFLSPTPIFKQAIIINF